MIILRDGESDAAVCAQITREHARTFSVASRTLPAEKRRAAFAVYAFCRIADDIVDEAAAASSDPRGLLEAHRARLIAAVHGQAGTPVFRELQWALRRFAIPVAPFHDLLNMLRRDLAPLDLATWDDLAHYCSGVASTVGEMCAHVFGVPSQAGDRARAFRHARTLGVALQLTNILRDVGEDAHRGRCYLPASDLHTYGLTRQDILSGSVQGDDPRWRALMTFQVARARSLYDAARPGLSLLDRDAQWCANICASGYAAILDALERRKLDSLSGRACVGTLRKAWIVADAWRVTRVSTQPAAASSPMSPSGDHAARA